MLTRRGFLKFVLGGIAAVAALAGYPIVEAMAAPRVTRLQLTPPRWTPGLKLKIVALSDFHACQPWMSAGRIGAICEQANALEPDIILLLGDFVAGMRLVTGPVDANEWASVLSRLRAPLGVHAILGNHDYWHDEAFSRDHSTPTESEMALSNAGVPVYINRSVRLEKDGYPFWLAGLGDQLATEFGVDDLPATLAQVTDAAPVILLAHEPDIFPEVTGKVSLTLSGHTHGGQIRLFGWAPVVPSRYGQRYLAGHIEENGRHIIVSRGLGCTSLPIRFGSWPEILQIELG